MGVLGIYIKKNDKVQFSQPIYAEEHSELANWLTKGSKFIENHIQKTSPPENLINALRLSKNEEKALRPNNFQESADDTLDYYKSIEEKPPVTFCAIGSGINEQGDYGYLDKYSEYENWTDIYTLNEALVKISKVAERNIKIEFSKPKTDDYFKDDILRNLMNLYIIIGILKSLKETHNPDFVALINAPM
ncbi:hypothetical protein [Olleya sp. HaHaR_3_96]|uniref:hypothetical protein n=1 Tax=Olleya sp. HaHaR_3_96 TaxID=2745560 RepID=UPI001C501248|nr:hypothetical protein [Olleya sp. HaHaR_3_96]QXP60867.1 hypothetical protein H0I26_04305 [Olleya sp. HaHaR_3_96]